MSTTLRTKIDSRRVRVGRRCWPLVLLAVACSVEPVAPDEPAIEPEEGAGQELFATPGCEGDGPCTAPSLSQAQCAAALLDSNFTFEAFQTFDVPTARTYSFVTLGARRLYANATGELVVQVRALTGGLPTLATSPVVATARLAGSLVSRSNGLVTLRFETPVLLSPAAGLSPRYALVASVSTGRLAVGLACAENLDAYLGGEAGYRKSRMGGGGSLVAGAWQVLRRDLSFALGSDARRPGTCTTTAGALCDDGNALSGDGCSSSCTPESGFTCTGTPSTCTDVNECATNNGGCGAAPCLNTTGSSSCGGACTPGTFVNGSVCSPCHASCATCTAAGSAACTACPAGSYLSGGSCLPYSVSHCGIYAPAADACVSCAAGFSPSGPDCVDVNECTANTDNCHADAACKNTAGAFTCACNSGYTGNGVSCADVDECTANTDDCHANATCTNTPGAFTCACSSGYSGSGLACTDVDECALNTDNCHANATCTNTAGSFTCACSAGYAGDGTTSCVPTLFSDAATGFIGYVGSFSEANRTWSTTPGPGHGYRGVTLARTFGAAENFELITSWAANYRGACMVYGPSVSHTTFNGGQTVYCGDRSSSGYATGTFFGQYHAPLQGGGAATTKYWFKHARSGNTLSLQYSATAATGPWSDVLAPVTVASSDLVVVTLGEAGDTEPDPLRLVSLKASACPPGYTSSGATCVDVDECATNNGGCGTGIACTNVAGGRACGFVDPVSGFSSSVGSLSNANRTWSTATGPGSGNRGVVVARTFGAGEPFEVVTSWAANYRGGCMVYGPSVAHGAFNGGDNVYCGGLSSSGFATGGWFGQYHAPAQSLGSGIAPVWFRQSRTGNTLAFDFSWASPTGPWWPVLAPVTIGASDKVAVVLGEAGDTEVAPLQLVSLRASTCPSGYADSGGTCVDVNECTTNTDNCSDFATCTNTAGAFTCACNAGYTGNGVTCNAVPTNLRYTANPATYTTTVAITANTPANDGTALTGYSVSPALPTGLTLNTSTGAITGTPMAVAAAANYVVTGTNAYGSTQATLSIAVVIHAPASCRDVPLASRVGNTTYTIDPDGVGTNAPFGAWCDMTTDGGGWTLVVRVKDGVDGSHRTAAAVGTVSGPTQTTTAKYSDTVINLLRGPDYTKSAIRMWLDSGQIDYFRESRAFAALGYTGSINRAFNTWSTVLANTPFCDGTYNSTFHTGLVGWGCYDSMLYADNPGMRGLAYSAGTVWVKRLALDGSD